MGNETKITPEMSVLVLGGTSKTLKEGGEPKTKVMGFHERKQLFDLDDTSTYGGDTVFMDEDYLMFSDFYSGIAILDARDLKPLFQERHPEDGNFGRLLANERYVFATIGTGHNGSEDTMVLDRNTLKPVQHITGGYDACLNGGWFVVSPQRGLAVFDAKTLKPQKNISTSDTFNYNVTSSGEYIAVNNGRGEVIFLRLQDLTPVRTLKDESFERGKNNFSRYPLVSNSKLIGVMLKHGVFDFYDTKRLEKVGVLDFNPMLVQKAFYLGEDAMFAYQARQIAKAADPAEYEKTVGKYFRQSIGVYDIDSMRQADEIEIPQDIAVHSMHFRSGRVRE